MKIIKENIANLERAIENDKVNMVGSMPIVMADAFYDSEKTQEKIDKEMEDHTKKTKVDLNKVIGAGKQPVPDMPAIPKSTLDESLFEDYNKDEFDESLNESRKKEELDLWDAVYEELSCDIGFKGSNRKISSKEFPNKFRFRFDDEYGFDYNDGPGIKSKRDFRNALIKDNLFILDCVDKNQLEFAKKVADVWGVDFKNKGLKAVITIPEHSIEPF